MRELFRNSSRFPMLIWNSSKLGLPPASCLDHTPASETFIAHLIRGRTYFDRTRAMHGHLSRCLGPIAAMETPTEGLIPNYRAPVRQLRHMSRQPARMTWQLHQVVKRTVVPAPFFR